MLRLNSIALNGYRSFGSEAKAADLADVNLIVGPNNVGKSNLTRFLQMIQTTLQDARGVWSQADPWPSIAGQMSCPLMENDFWLQKPCPIEADILCEIDDFPPDVSDFVGADGAVHVRIKITPRHNSYVLEINLVSGPGALLWKGDSSQPRIFVGGGYNERPAEGEGTVKLLKRICRALADELLFVDAMRNPGEASKTSPPANIRPGRSDGRNIVAQLAELAKDTKNSSKWAVIRRKLKRWITVLLGYEVDLEATPAALFVTQKIGEGEVRLSLDDLGTGVSQFVMLLSFLLLTNEHGRIIVIEEPEAHLHPGAVLEMTKIIHQEFPGHQVFLTTHSSALLDGSSPDWRVVRTTRGQHGVTAFFKLDTSASRLALLSELGIRPSQMFMANCVVWVEGPSDVHYLRRLLRTTRKGLVEGRSHAFIVYGGSLISYLGFDEAAAVRLLSINPYNIVICDRDRRAGDEYKPAVQRLMSAAEALGSHACVMLVPAREIELCIQPRVMSAAASHVAAANMRSSDPQDRLSYDLKQWNQEMRFHQQVARAAQLSSGAPITGDQLATLETRLTALKTELSQYISEGAAGDVFIAEASEWGQTMATFIERANG